MVIIVHWSTELVSIYLEDTHVPVRLDTEWTALTPRVFQWTNVRPTSTRVTAMQLVSQQVQELTHVNVYLNLRVMEINVNVR